MGSLLGRKRVDVNVWQMDRDWSLCVLHLIYIGVRGVWTGKRVENGWDSIGSGTAWRDWGGSAVFTRRGRCELGVVLFIHVFDIG